MKSQLLDYQGSPGSDFFIVGMLCLCCSYFPDNRFCIRTLVFHTQFVFSLMQFEGTGGFEVGHCNEYLLSLWYFLLFSHVWVFVTPWTAACQAFLSFTTFQSLLRLMSVESVMPSNHLILCHTFFSCLQSFLASWSFPMSRFFASGGQYFGASASVLLLNAAAAKSLQSCLTLCDQIDGSPPGSPVPGILQARTLEWVAISSSNAWEWKVKVKPLSRVRLLVSSWTAAYQAPLSMGFSKQEYWSGVPLPSLPSTGYSGLISFRIDWFDLLAVQGTLKSLLQHHSSKASILPYDVLFFFLCLFIFGCARSS